MRSRFLFLATVVFTACSPFDPSGGRPDGLTSGDCYSPTQNLDQAYVAGAVGCACAGEPAVCVADSTGRRVALICDANLRRWVSAEDGPCSSGPQVGCYSPTQNLDRAYVVGAVGCACAGEPAVCVADSDGRQVALICDPNLRRWVSAEDGPCSPMTQLGCYSPTQNLDRAYVVGAVGCACAGEPAVCVADSTGRRVALICDPNLRRWVSAEDGPCSSGPQVGCYSPTQNLDRAYVVGAVGCACAGEPAVCVADSTGRRVALICDPNLRRWVSAEDGPCSSGPQVGCYSPTQNLDRAYVVGAVGCACAGEPDVCVADSDGRQVALTCDSNLRRWVSVQDGACQPRP